MGSNKKRVFVLGGTGFVGWYLLRALDEAGFEIGLLLHKKTDDLEIPFSGYKTFTGDIKNKKSLQKAMQEFKPDVVMNLVGIIKERPPAVTFKKIHVEGTKNALDAAKSAGAEKFIYVSALGADKNGSTKYYRTKAQAEDIVKNSGLNYTIFRPDVMFGWRSPFTNRIKNFVQKWPVVPVVGRGEEKFQPVAAQTTAEVITQSAQSTGTNQTYDVVGPEVITMREAAARVVEALGIEKRFLAVPQFLVKIGAIMRILITPAQLKMLLEEHLSAADKFKKDFKYKEIYFDPKGDYPLY